MIIKSGGIISLEGLNHIAALFRSERSDYRITSQLPTRRTFSSHEMQFIRILETVNLPFKDRNTSEGERTRNGMTCDCHVQCTVKRYFGVSEYNSNRRDKTQSRLISC